jgi:hypothetical protein
VLRGVCVERKDDAHLARDDLVLALEGLIRPGNIPNANWGRDQLGERVRTMRDAHLSQRRLPRRSKSPRARCALR